MDLGTKTRKACQTGASGNLNPGQSFKDMRESYAIK